MSDIKETKKSPNPTKGGREPIVNRSSVYEVLKETDYTAKDALALTDKQKAYLKTNDIVHRFVYKKEYLKNNNFHRSGWKVISDPNMPGTNAEGLVEVGDLVLAVKTTQAQKVHKDNVQARANRTFNQANKAAGEELRDKARKAGLSAEIHVGYEENGGEEKDEE
jgi:hypothetical protein